jgi:hypothetical protein
MNQRTNPVWLLAILWLVLGCKEGIKPPNSISATTDSLKSMKPTPPKPNQSATAAMDIYTQAAVETCNCMHPMLEKAKSLKELEANNQITDMKRVANEMAQLQPQIQKCSDEIRRKYSQFSSHDDEKRILTALLTQCPDMAMLFSSLGKMVTKNK